MSFTPGPWRFDRDWMRVPSIIAQDGTIVADVRKARTENGWVVDLPEREANARLIEAAPDLLAALKKAAAIITGENTSKSLLIDALEQTRAALTKAEGHIGQELAPGPERRVNGNANGDEG